jgi:formylglycine-generating enzyme required for sulfatase activity
MINKSKKNKLKKSLLLSLSLVLLGASVIDISFVKNNNIAYSDTIVETGKRKALVIGNKNYSNASTLNNTHNDADAVAKKLNELKFEVTKKYDLKNKKDMKSTIQDFYNNINQNDTVFVYYSGHGVQIKDENYLVPTNADLKIAADAEEEAISLKYILDALKEKSNVLFVVLDACRDNPLKNKSIGQKGLSAIRAESGKQLVVLFATGENETASDYHPVKKNLGLFAGELVDVLGMENKTSDSIFNQLTSNLKKLSNGQQIPYKHTQLEGDFYFNQVASIAVPRVTATPREESPEVVVTNVYGSVDVSSKTGGILYIDGKRISEIGEGQEVSISKIKAGYRKLKMEYEGKSEEKDVYVERDNNVKVSFQYIMHIVRLPTIEREYEEKVPEGFVKVEGGTFKMGDTFGYGPSDEKPMHSVKVDSFYIGKYEVTQKEYKAVMGNNPSNFKGDNLPVESVSFNKAVEFCNKYNKLKGLPNAYDSSGNIVNWKSYRLPTEAEWEYAAKGGNKSKGYKYSGSNNLMKLLGIGITHQVRLIQ